MLCLFFIWLGCSVKRKYQIVHTHTAKAGIIGRVAGRLAGVPVVIHTSHGLPFYEGKSKLKYYTYRFLEKIGAWFCDAIAWQNREDMKKNRAICSAPTCVL